MNKKYLEVKKIRDADRLSVLLCMAVDFDVCRSNLCINFSLYLSMIGSSTTSTSSSSLLLIHSVIMLNKNHVQNHSELALDPKLQFFKYSYSRVVNRFRNPNRVKTSDF